MDIIERIDESIEELKEPNGKVFDFDKELELLVELRKVVREHSRNQSVIDGYKIKVEEMKKTVSSLIVEKEVSEINYKECISEVNKFYGLMQNEIASKMRLLEYPDYEISRVSRIRNFSELYSLREKVFHEFDVKFRVQYVVDDSPGKETLDYTMFKV